MKKYEKQDQKLMATWAANCVERVLPFFEKAYPKDDRPRKAIEACRTWLRTGLTLLMPRLKLPKNIIGRHGIFQQS